MIWFTSDTHFGHGNILKYNPERNCSDVSEMDNRLIDNWNSLISPSDTVFHLGDFAVSLQVATRVVEKLNGKKVLVSGNHDAKHIRDRGFCRKWSAVYRSYHEERIDGILVVMCHYPIWEWNQIFRGSFHLHGHVHAKPTGVPGKIMDVGVDTNNLLPYNWDQVRQIMDAKPPRSFD